MRVLVTGHHGYVGSVLAPLLAQAGHDVAGLDTFFYRGCDFGEPRSWPDEQDIDIRDVERRHLEGFDAIVHLAALSNDPLGDLSPRLTHDINLEGTLAVARAAREAGVARFVFASSCSMYGAAASGDLLDESAELRPLTPYAESKVAAEEALHELADKGFCVVSMRNATIYGVSPRLRLDIVLNNLAAWAVTTGSIRLLSDGSSWRPLLHVRDAARVTDLLLRAPAELVSGEAFNVGSNDQNDVVRELAEILSRLTGCDVTFADDAAPDPRSYRVDFSKLARAFPELVFEWNAERGARELVDAYQRFGLTLEQFESRSYVRLRQLRHLLDTDALGADLRWTPETVAASR
jgi:nucleoside-diphosphate-sugar epimerase